MILSNKLRELIDFAGFRLDHHQNFSILVDLPLPLVNGDDFRDDVDTGCQLLADDFMRKLLGNSLVWRSHETRRSGTRLKMHYVKKIHPQLDSLLQTT